MLCESYLGSTEMFNVIMTRHLANVWGDPEQKRPLFPKPLFNHCAHLQNPEQTLR